jgi:hypothetical protein
MATHSAPDVVLLAKGYCKVGSATLDHMMSAVVSRAVEYNVRSCHLSQAPPRVLPRTSGEKASASSAEPKVVSFTET